MKRLLPIKILVPCLLFLLGAGCSFRSAPETRYTAKEAAGKVCRVAVLPFENRTPNPEAGTMAYRIFYGELLASGAFDVEPEGEMRLFMLRHRLLPGQLLNAAHYADLSERMSVDTVISGIVVDVGMDSRKAGEKVPFVSMQIDMFDVRSGQRLLSTFHRHWGDDYRKTMHFGMVRTVTGVMSHLSREVIEDWVDSGMGNCN